MGTNRGRPRDPDTIGSIVGCVRGDIPEGSRNILGILIGEAKWRDIYKIQGYSRDPLDRMHGRLCEKEH